MKKISQFLMVGLAFTALQLSTVSAQTGMPPTGNQGMPPMGNQGMPPTGNQGMPPMGNQGMPPTGNQGMPPTGNQGMPPMGNQGMPPTGEMDCVNAGNPTEVAACWDAKAHAKGPPGMKDDHPDCPVGTTCGSKTGGPGMTGGPGGHHDGPPGMRGEHRDGPRGKHRMGKPDMPPMGADMGPTFKDCRSIKPKGDFAMMKDKKNCFRDVAKSLGAKGAKVGFGKCKKIKPKGDLALMKEKKNCFRDVAKSLK
jgi:hypothetical protein